MRAPALALLLAGCASTGNSMPDHRGAVTDLCAVAGGIASCSQAGVLVERPGQPARRLATAFRACALAADPERDVLLVVGGEPATAGRAIVIASPATSPGEGATAVLADDLLYDAAISPDGRAAVIACDDGRVLRVGMPGLDEPVTLQRHTGPCRAVAFSPDGARVVSGSLDGSLLVHTGGPAPQVLQDHTAGIECMAFAPDGRLASGARDGKVRLHAPGGRLLRTYQKLGAPVTALCWHPTRGTFFVGLRDGSLLQLAAENATSSRCASFGAPVTALLPHDEGLKIGLRGEISYFR